MSRVQMIRPSFPGSLWSTLKVLTVIWLISSNAAFAVAMAISWKDRNATSGGEYVRLYIIAYIWWGPALLFTLWFISIPVIVVLGVLFASIRRREADESSEQTPLER